MRGKRGGRGKKSEIMARNLREVENTLDTVSLLQGGGGLQRYEEDLDADPCESGSAFDT